MGRVILSAMLLAILLGGCTLASHAWWKLAPGSSSQEDLARLEATLRESGYERGTPDADPCESQKTLGYCYMVFGRPYREGMSVELEYPLRDGGVGITFVELFDRKFSPHGAGLLRDLSARLEREFGPRVKLVYPRELPS